MADFKTTGSDFTEIDGGTNYEKVSHSEKSILSETKNETGHWSGQIPSIAEKLEERFPFSATIIALVGYITIASFGEMETDGQYLGYLFFLIVIYLFYYFIGKTINIIVTLLIAVIIIETVFIAYIYRDKLNLTIPVKYETIDTYSLPETNPTGTTTKPI